MNILNSIFPVSVGCVRVKIWYTKEQILEDIGDTFFKRYSIKSHLCKSCDGKKKIWFSALSGQEFLFRYVVGVLGVLREEGGIDS